jgi:hypothetical protein
MRVNSMTEFDETLKQSLTDSAATTIDVPVGFAANAELLAQLGSSATNEEARSDAVKRRFWGTTRIGMRRGDIDRTITGRGARPVHDRAVSRYELPPMVEYLEVHVA